jgi:hypothetical protein
MEKTRCEGQQNKAGPCFFAEAAALLSSCACAYVFKVKLEVTNAACGYEGWGLAVPCVCIDVRLGACRGPSGIDPWMKGGFDSCYLPFIVRISRTSTNA